MQNVPLNRDGQIATNETMALIASDKVEGTEVYNRAGEHLGAIHNLMIDKQSGQVTYAVMSFGGFLGLGQDYHPLPWRALRYDPATGGYIVDIDKERLRAAPTYQADQTGSWSDPAYRSRVDDFYGFHH